MTGGLIGWFIGAILSLITVTLIPGDQGLWSGLIGFGFGFTGFMIGLYIEERKQWRQ